MYKYIMLDDNNIVVSEQLSEREIDDDKLLLVSDTGTRCIGKKYESGLFSDVAIEDNSTSIRVSRLKLRMTQQERIDIREKAATDPITADFMDLLNGETVVRVDDPNVIGGLAYLENSNVLNAGRANQLLAMPILDDEKP